MGIDDLDLKQFTIEDLTEGKINGTGVFDTLMQSINAQLLEQFNRGRIESGNYAEVYLGSLQSAISQSIQFLLTKDKAALDGLLVEAQIKQTDANTELVTAQAELAILEKDKVNAEIEVLQQQLLNLQQEKLNLEAAKLKTDAEIDLLKQKKVTELAQTEDGASGVVGAQIALYGAQKQGFVDDAKVKRVKAANDVFAIAKSNDPTAVNDPVNMISTLESTLTQLLQQ